MVIDEQPRRLAHALDRRTVLRTGALAAGGLAAAALIGCGSDEEEAAPAGGATSTGTAAAQSGTPADGITVAGKFIPFNFPEPAGKTPKAGGTATFAVTWDVSTMDPSKSAAGGTVTVPNVVYNRLLGFKRGPRADPFKLEPNVKWQNIAPLNGRAFSAADVKFAYERYQKEGVHRPYFTNVKSIEAPDATTVKLTLNKPQPDLLIPLASRYTTIHPKELVDSGEIDKKAIGTGPMILKEAASGVGATFDKSPDYWMGKVLIDQLVCKVQTDGAAQLAAFRAKQIEFGYTVGTTVIELEQLLKTNPDIQANTAQPVTNTFAISFNLDLPKWQDVRTRRAVSMIMDRKEIIDIALRTYGVSTPTMPWIFIFDKPPTAESGQLGKWWKTDVAEAKKLLEAAGQSNLEMPMIYYNYGDSSNKTPNEVLVNQFQKAGVKLDARSVDYTEFNSQWVGAKFPDVADGWAAQGFDTDNFFYQHVRSDSPGNRWRIKDTELDAWAEQQRSEIDPQKRKEILRKMWDKTLDQAYRIEKPGAIAATVYQPWLRGVRWVGVLGANSYYYDIGAQLTNMWLDK